MDWRNKLECIQNKIRGQLHARKIDDLEGVYRLMAQFDKDNSGYLDKDEFQKFLSQIGVFLTTQELRSVYDKYDSNKDGNIAYAEFVSLIRENMSQKRIDIVNHAFEFLDAQKQGRLGLSYLSQVYNARNHPRVRTRQKTADQMIQEFNNAIAKRSTDGVTISQNEFLNYYADCNATLPNEKEEYFADMVISTWGITSGVDYVSPQRLAQLEQIVFEKIRQKTLPKDDEGITVKKAFKYFDLTDQGTIDIRQFAQALAKFGCVFNEKEIVALFNKYDQDRTGKLCFDEFCGLIARMGAGTNPNMNPVFKLAREPPKQTLNKIKSELQKKGQHSVRKMQKTFNNSDKNKQGVLNRQEFQWAMKESGFTLTKTEYDNIFKYFDKNFDDFVSFKEFISFLRFQVPLNQRRCELVQQVFDCLDQGQQGVIPWAQLKQNYDASKSWDVQCGRKTVAEAQKDFCNQFEGDVSKDDWLDYYTDVSALIDDDNQFEQGLRGVWRL